MAWVTPSTRSTGYVVTAANWNEFVNDLRYLKGLDGAVAIENALTLTQVSTPSAPGAGLTALYAKSDGAIYKRAGASGAEEEVGGAGFASRFLLMGG
jgi:acetylornithine deacetylase/succinyl-diaminopimelate desuccinylase-like protein